MPIVLGPDPGLTNLQLQEIEREVMLRTGPFERHVASNGAHTSTSVFVDALRSTMTLGGYTGLWLLRRGFTDDDTENGSIIVGHLDDDRQRRVKAWDPLTGRIDVDRPWTRNPVQGEWLEVCHLDPHQVIRRATINGLRRIRIKDRTPVTLTGVAAERNLTAALPWILSERHVLGLSYAPVGAVYDPSPVRWFNVYESGGEVWASVSPDPYPNVLYVTTLRPAHSLVGGIYIVGGPTHDDDVLSVSLERAAAAGHIECWRFPRAAAMLAALADRKITATQAQAADEHTHQNRRKNRRVQTRWQLSRPLWNAVERA